MTPLHHCALDAASLALRPLISRVASGMLMVLSLLSLLQRAIAGPEM